MPLHGGVRQRLKLAHPVPAEPAQADGPTKTKTFSTGGRQRAFTIGQFLTGLFTIGRLSAPELQEGSAASSSSSGRADATIKKLGKAGNNGKLTGNMSRDVMTTLGKTCKKPPIYQTKITVWDSINNRQKRELCDFQLPYETLDHEIEKTGVYNYI